MARKSYYYAQLEAVAQEMRADPEMAYYYEYQKLRPCRGVRHAADVRPWLAD